MTVTAMRRSGIVVVRRDAVPTELEKLPSISAFCFPNFCFSLKRLLPHQPDWMTDMGYLPH